jgi:hypothetical protein
MTRGKPLARKTPLRRSRLKRRSPRRIAKATPEELMYRGWIHGDQCAGRYTFWTTHFCTGRLEQSHERDMTGLGLKASEFRSVAMCTGLHQEWEQHRIHFAGWTKQQRRLWMVAQITASHARYEMETGSRLGGQP